MIKKASISITLDSSHQKKDESYPLRLRLIFNKKARYFSFIITLPDYSEISSLTKDEFAKVLSEKSRHERYRLIKAGFEKEKTKASEIVNFLGDGFSFDKFRKYYVEKAKISDQGNVYAQYRITIERLEKENRYGSVSVYKSSLACLKKYSKDLRFEDITVNWLREFEKSQEINTTTIGIYLRCLKAIFNEAIEERIIHADIYPFKRTASQRNKYQIPRGGGTKRALSKDELSELFKIQGNSDQEKARDFFFLSYTLNGMNIADICLLKNEDITADQVKFSRKKTHAQPITIPLTDFAKTIIERYRVSGNDYIFPILKKGDLPITIHQKIHGFTNFVNKNLKSLSGRDDISTYFARHSFATLAIQNGASLEFVSDALAHSSTSVTKAYFNGFEDSVKKDLLNKLIDL